MKHPSIYNLAGKAARLFAPLMLDERGRLRVPVWGETRDFPALPEKTFKELWKEAGHVRT
jgi:L-lactate dehydrogenase complex protein LldF